MGADVSFLYSLGKDVGSWLRRQISKPIHWWKKRRFLDEGWNPVLEEINKSTETIFSKALLSDSPEVVIREKGEEKQIRKYGKKMTLFVSDEEIKSKQLDNESLIGVTKHIIKTRTGAFRPFLPSDIRRASDDVATESVIWDVRPDAIDDFYDYLEPTDDETDATIHSKVEQMILGAEYDDFCEHVIAEYGEEKPCLRIQKMVSESFERSFKKLQESFRGILIKISAKRFQHYTKGLKLLLLPHNTSQLLSYNDAYAFIWIYPDGIVAFGPLDNITNGKFEDLWGLYSRTHCQVEGKSNNEVYQIVSGWVKGVGGKKGKQSKIRPSSGPALTISIGLIEMIVELVTPIDKEEFRNLVQSRLTNFSMLTQKQVNILIERGR